MAIDTIEGHFQIGERCAIQVLGFSGFGKLIGRDAEFRAFFGVLAGLQHLPARIETHQADLLRIFGNAPKIAQHKSLQRILRVLQLALHEGCHVMGDDRARFQLFVLRSLRDAVLGPKQAEQRSARL